ncbi:MAG: hypothetical protein PHI31_10075 [Desulfuromonadaceae bacterium]|nr:hypothetical protein [Desulfuromonadaceae bacterium]
MINLTPRYIEEAGGLLRAISLKSAEVVRSVLGENNIKPINKEKLDKLDRILVHTSPHLDEYLAVLLFRACLPPQKLRELQLEEFTLNSINNDQLAKVTWRNAAVIGIGGTHTGGARALFNYDEHVETGKVRKDSSCSMLVSKRHLNDPGILYKAIGEIDHIDAYANAHDKHLGNYIKWMHESEYFFSIGSSTKDHIKDSISPTWKQTLIEACLAAYILASNDKKRFNDASFWKQYAEDSLDAYKKYSLLRKVDPKFTDVFGRLKGNISRYEPHYLLINKPGGGQEEKKDKYGNRIEQKLVMPYLAALCQYYWGPEIGHIIMAHFWDARVQSQITYANITEVLKTTIGDGTHEIPPVRTPMGQLTFRHIPVAGASRKPWVVEFVLKGAMPNSKAPLLSYINNNNDGNGYLILHNSSTNNIVLNKGYGVNSETWKALCDKLLQVEGDSSAKIAGCWYKLVNDNGNIAGFMLNGNKAHQYVPKTSIDADSLVGLVKEIIS